MGKNEGKEKMLVKGAWPTLLICGFGGGVIYLLPYLSGTWGPELSKALGCSTTEMGTMVTMFGIINCLLYLPSGLLADRFSSKKLIVFSLLATGILGAIYACFPPMPVMYILHILLGLTSTFTFWSVCVNTVRCISSEKKQGTVYSVWYILKGGSAGITALVAVPIVGAFADSWGIRTVIILYAALTFLAGILAIFFLKEVKITGANEFHMKDVKKLKRYPALWIVGIAAMAVWIGYICCFQMPKYLVEIYSVSTDTAGLWKTLACQILPFPAAALSGVIADKLCKSKMQFMTITMVLLTITAALLLGFVGKANAATQIALFVIFNQFLVAAIAIIFSVIGELKIPFAISGTAAGVLSFLYYLPETFGYAVTGKMVETPQIGVDPETGLAIFAPAKLSQFQTVFIFLFVACVIGTIAMMLAWALAKRTKVEVSAEEMGTVSLGDEPATKAEPAKEVVSEPVEVAPVVEAEPIKEAEPEAVEVPEVEDFGTAEEVVAEAENDVPMDAPAFEEEEKQE